MLVSPGWLYNVYETSLRSSRVYTIDEYFNDVFAVVWKPLTDQDERQNDYRRQREKYESGK